MDEVPLKVRLLQAGIASLFGMLASGVGATGAPVPMVLQAVDTIGSDSADFSLPPTAIISPVTALRLRFEYPVALQPRDLQLVEAGPDGRIDTRYCSALPSGDDRHVTLAALRHGEPATEVAADFGPASGLPAGHYRFLLCEQVAAPTYGHDFAIAETNRLANPNFSTGLAGWQVVPHAGARMTHSGLDADGSRVSGALRIHGAAQEALLAYSETCVHDLHAAVHRLRFKYRVLQGDVRIRMTVLAGFAGDQEDAPCVGPIVQQYSLEAHSGPAPHFTTLDSGRLPPFYAPAAMLAISVWSTGDAPFEVLLDDVGLGSNPDAVFASHFD